MTLRGRLTFAFFVVLLGPAVLGTSALASVLPWRAEASVERARAAVRIALIVRCQHLQAAAEALAVRLSVNGDPFGVTPPNAPGPWALCGAGGSGHIRLPAGTWYRGLAARVEVRDHGGFVTAHAYAVQSLDEPFLRELSVAAGASVTLIPVDQVPVDRVPMNHIPVDHDFGGGDAQQGAATHSPTDASPLADLLPLAISVVPPAGTDQFPVAVTAAITAGVVAALLAWWLAGMAVRPLWMLVRIVEQVAAGDLNARSRLDGRDETGRLGSGLDHLIAGMQETQRMSLTDALTNLGNVRHLSDSLHVEIERASRFGRTLGVLVLDLDHFKMVNDRYGHRAGDAVLVEFALRVRGVVREVDLAFRQGGEEFVILLPETDISGSLTAARRIGEAVREKPFEVARHHSGEVDVTLIDDTSTVTLITVSIGVAVYPHHARTGPGILEAADEALYAAKAAGRDRHMLARTNRSERTGPAGPVSSPEAPSRVTPVG